MPKMVDLIPNPNFEPKGDAQTAAFAAVKKHGAINGVAHISAMESIKASGGMYAIKPEVTADAPAAKVIVLEDLDAEQIKTMLMLQGIKIKAGMTKDEAIAALRAVMNEPAP